MVELVWEYSSQMEARQLTNPFEYVARCRHWKQFQFERQQAIQSLPASSSGQSEDHLPVPVSGLSQQQPPCPPSNELVSLSNSEPRELSNTARNSSTMQMMTSSGVGLRAQETDLARPSRQESFIPQTQIASQPQHSQPSSAAFQTPTREQVMQLERAFVAQSSASAVGLLVSQQAGVPQTQTQAQSTGAVDSADVLCRDCYDKPFNVVLVHCGHFAVCSSCAERCKDYPICHRPIRGTVLIPNSR